MLQLQNAVFGLTDTIAFSVKPSLKATLAYVMETKITLKVHVGITLQC